MKHLCNRSLEAYLHNQESSINLPVAISYARHVDD